MGVVVVVVFFMFEVIILMKMKMILNCLLMIVVLVSVLSGFVYVQMVVIVVIVNGMLIMQIDVDMLLCVFGQFDLLQICQVIKNQLIMCVLVQQVVEKVNYVDKFEVKVVMQQVKVMVEV